jgi:hypothetical protein
MTYLPNNLAGDTVVSLTRVQQNDAALDTAISGNLTEANLSSATQIPSSMLASSDVEEIIVFTVNPRLAAGAVLGAASTTVPYQFVKIGGTGSYTVTSATYAYTVTTGGTTNGSISVRAGTITAGLWVTSSTVVGPTAINDTVTGGQSASGNLSLTTASFSAPTHIALMPEGAGNTAVIALTVTLKIIRALQ